MTTLHEQLKELAPLPQGVIGLLAGHTHRGSIANKRQRGSVLNSDQLRLVAEGLRELAARAELLASAAAEEEGEARDETGPVVANGSRKPEPRSLSAAEQRAKWAAIAAAAVEEEGA